MKLSPEQKHANQVERTAERLRAMSPGNQINDVAKVFQKLVKMREADEDGMCKCVTCPARYRFNDSKLNAGHFISRQYRAVVFNFTNCHPQCARCNDYLSGNAAIYHQWMVGKYGKEHVDGLESQTKVSKKFDVTELAELKIGFAAQCREEMKRLK